MSIFAKRLRELRTECDMSYEKLAEAIGVAKTSVFRWENAQADIKSEYLVAIAKYFGVSVDYLVGEADV
jgi:transcriptional regulator with XRE-family HTH domain